MGSMVLSTIQGAIVARQRLRIVYQQLYAEHDTEREIEPIGLLHYSVGWHLIAWCTLRQAYRDFRTDRIVSLTNTGQVFTLHDRLSLNQYLDGLRCTGKLTEVQVCFSLQFARLAQTHRYSYGYVDEVLDGGQVRMRFLTGWPEGLCRWLLAFGDQIHIDSPPAMRAVMQRVAQEATDHWNRQAEAEPVAEIGEAC